MDRPNWIERMTPEDRASHFRHYSPEEFLLWVAERKRRGVPSTCEHAETLAQVAEMVAAEQ